METNNVNLNDVKETSIGYDLKYCDCLSKICGCEVNSRLTKGFIDSLLKYFQIKDIVESITNGERLNSIYLWGTENRSTKDLENWLSDYMPFKIEWINDNSCNLVFDTITECFVVLENLTEDYEFDNDADVKRNKPEEVLYDGIYRQVINLPEGTEKMFMRLANKSDVKVKGAEKYSRFYLTHGNPRYNNMKGLTSKSFREKLKRNHDSISREIDNDEGLVVYDDLPKVDQDAPETDESDKNEDDFENSGVEKKRKMISSMKLYSDRIEERSYRGGRLKMDEKKKSVHSRLG